MNSSKRSNEYKSFDGSPKSWIELFTNTPLIAAPGGVILFWGNEHSLDKIIVGWYIAVAILETKSGNPFYSHVIHILPEKFRISNILRNIKPILQKQTKTWNWSHEQTEWLINRVRVQKPSSFDGLGVIETLHHLPDGSAVAIPYAELYRFSDIDESCLTSISNWAGINYTSTINEQKYSVPLMRLTTESLNIAKKKSLFITLFCEEYELIQHDLPSDLQNHPDLAVIRLTSPNNDYENLEMLPEWLNRIEIEGLDIVLTKVDQTVKNPENRALLKSYLLSANQQFDAAWRIIEPYLKVLIASDNGKLLLILSQRAFDAGKRSESKVLLKTAIERGINSLEEINLAYLIAESLDLDNLCNNLFAQMCSNYPNSKITLVRLYKKYFETRDFSSASKLAERLKEPFLAKLCQAFTKQELELTKFFAYAGKKGKTEKAYMYAAYEAEHRNKNLLAREWASNIGTNSEFSSEAIRIRTRIIGRMVKTHYENLEEEILELLQIMQFTATHPTDIETRFEIEELLESGVDEPTAQLMLYSILMIAIDKSFKAITSHNFNFETPSELYLLRGFDLKSVENDSFYFYSEILNNMKASNPFILLGRGEVPEFLKPLVNSNLLRGFLFTLQHLSLRSVYDDITYTLYYILHIIALLSREMADPNSDFLAVKIIIGFLANTGYAQESRNLAETSLLTLAGTQPTQLSWRISQAWACYADAFHRTGNIMAALRCLCFSFLSWEKPALNRNVLCDSYRIAARILRDLRYTDAALEVTNLERQIWNKTGGNELFSLQLDEIELSIKMADLSRNTSPDLLIELLTKISNLLTQSQNEEITPLLTCQANLIRLLKLTDTQIPNQIEKQFYERLNKQHKSIQRILNSTITIAPTRDDLLLAIQQIPSSNSFSDLSYQIRGVIPLAENAIRYSHQQKDIELFILASAISSQPILSLKTYRENNSNLLQRGKEEVSNLTTIEQPEVFKENLEGVISFQTYGSPDKFNWYSQLLIEDDPDKIKLKDAYHVVQNIASPIKKSIEQLTKISLSQIQAIIQPDEAIIILAHDPVGNLCRAVIYHDNYVGPELLSEEIWSPLKYNEWSRFFPRGYTWEPAPNPFTEENPSEKMVKDSLKSLSIGEFELPKTLSIIPDAKLFGFPFVLAPSQGTYLGQNIKLGISPSIQWLLRVRTAPLKENISKKAWLGSPSSEDFTLHFLRDRLLPSLRKYQVEIIESEIPTKLEHSSLAIITSHGGVGEWDYFRAITDTKRTYSAKEFASNLNGCGCVVLFVCNSGRSDPQIGSSKTLGLVTELLNVEIRSVVAPPWPLDVYVVEIWLPEFLENLLSGQSVGYSTFMASKKVRGKYSNPCAWGALQVYGDVTFTLKDIKT